MRFEWDEGKRRANLGKHKIDFIDAQEIFDGRDNYAYRSRFAAEERHVAIAWLIDRWIAVIWTWRGSDVIRIISARNARDGEKRKYRELHG